jgi:dolichyl-diphosphooligosaccharide--protein glycosyltransferase
MKMKIKKKNIKSEIEPETPEASSRANLISGLIAAFFFGVSFYIRVIIPLERAMINEGLVFAMDDAVFHMRLVENTIANFPHRIFYDAFTNYPYGNQLHWGALFEQVIAAFAILAGWIFDGGAPSQETINTVGAFYPAVLGALCVIPAYVIAKELAGRKAGIIAAALTAILPGQFLSRSVLGFTDNHIAEVFFLSIAVMFFVMTLKKSRFITLTDIRERKWLELKKPLICSALTGFWLGLYMLNWTAGVFFVVVFATFFLIQAIINHIAGEPLEDLLIISIPIFIIPALIVAPYVDVGNGFDSAYYSLLHVTVPLISLLIMVILYLISQKMESIHFEPVFYPIILLFLGWIGLNLMGLVLPDLHSTTVGNIDLMFKERIGGQRTVAEAMPISTFTALIYFGLNYYLSFLGLLILVYYGTIKHSAKHMLVAVWSIFIFAIMLAQVRFSYYYAVNVAVMTSIFAAWLLNNTGWKNYNMNSVQNTIRRIKLIPVIILILLVSIMFFMPADRSIYKISTTMTKQGALYAGYYEWYFAMDWMRNNTPDTGVNYLEIYERPAKGDRYKYPRSAYGVMSWWDYGHVISYWGRRIPNANPFQAGVTTVAAFLTAQTEGEGNKIMDDLGSKYVVTDGFMAYGIQGVFATWLNDKSIVDPGTGGRPNLTGYYNSFVITNRGARQVPGLKTYNSMTGRLHIQDTNGLTRYRLIHETASSPYTLADKTSSNPELERGYKAIFNQLYGNNISVVDSGYVKIFEYVKGAQIVGEAPANSTMKISVEIKTNVGRKFTYEQKTTADTEGRYRFIVPYSTTGFEKGKTKFDTKSLGRYRILFGNKTIELDVNESDVLNGEEILVPS